MVCWITRLCERTSYCKEKAHSNLCRGSCICMVAGNQLCCKGQQSLCESTARLGRAFLNRILIERHNASRKCNLKCMWHEFFFMSGWWNFMVLTEKKFKYILGTGTCPCIRLTLLLMPLTEARFRLNRCDQLILRVYCGMKLGTIWKEAHSHFHGTCSVYPMQSVNINSPTHAFSRDIKEVWSEVM